MTVNKNLEELVYKNDVVSFDIFDTLLKRPYINPYHLLKHLEKYTGKVGFYDARLKAERVARKTLNFEDITLEEIYSYIDDQYKDLISVELELEENLLQQNEIAYDIYKLAIENNKKVAIISDIYFPRDFIIRVLSKNGYDKFDYLYLSCETRKTKASGNMFKLFLKETELDCSKILHIGDNLISDVENATKNGLNSYFLEKREDKFLNENKRWKYLYDMFPDLLEISVFLSIYAKKWEQNKNILKNENTYWQDFGYLLGGIVCYGFLCFVNDCIKKNNIEQALFVARDCYILKKMFDNLNTNVKAHYIYAQRLIYQKCFLKYGDKHNADNLIEMLREKCDIPRFESYDDEELFIKNNQSLLEQESLEAKKDYNDYLDTVGVDRNLKTAIIDSGAVTFSAQNLLQGILGKSITGIYTMCSTNNASKMGLDTCNWSKTSLAIKSITGLIEFVMMAPEPPVVGLKKAKPVYIKNVRQEEVERNEICKILEKGIIEFAKDMNNTFGKYEIVLNATPVNYIVSTFATFLDNIDKKMLDAVKCATNSSHTKYNETLLTQLKKFNLIKDNDVKIFNVNLLKFEKTLFNSTLFLFGKVPVFTVEKDVNVKRAKLFGCIPLLKIKYKPEKQYIYIFGFIRLCKIVENDVL